MVKHEYLGGAIHAMAGATNGHNEIAMNALGVLYGSLRGKPCRPYNSDTKIRLELSGHTRFYYPDAMVVCHPNPRSDSFQDHPVVVIEVLSESTRRIDLGEKCDAYLKIPSIYVSLLRGLGPDQNLRRKSSDHDFDPSPRNDLPAHLR